jgi:hypothetical protein
MAGVNLPKDFDPKAHKARARKFAQTLPTRENCDLSDPQQEFLWMLVALPGMNGGQQAMPTSYNMLVSQHLSECGAMLQCPECGHMKEPLKVYVPPAASDAHWLTSPGRWMPPDKAPAGRSGDAIDKLVQGLSQQQKAAFLERLLRLREDGELQ